MVLLTLNCQKKNPESTFEIALKFDFEIAKFVQERSTNLLRYFLTMTATFPVISSWNLSTMEEPLVLVLIVLRPYQSFTKIKTSPRHLWIVLESIGLQERYSSSFSQQFLFFLGNRHSMWTLTETESNTVNVCSFLTLYFVSEDQCPYLQSLYRHHLHWVWSSLTITCHLSHRSIDPLTLPCGRDVRVLIPRNISYEN